MKSGRSSSHPARTVASSVIQHAKQPSLQQNVRSIKPSLKANGSKYFGGNRKKKGQVLKIKPTKRKIMHPCQGYQEVGSHINVTIIQYSTTKSCNRVGFAILPDFLINGLQSNIRYENSEISYKGSPEFLIKFEIYCFGKIFPNTFEKIDSL